MVLLRKLLFPLALIYGCVTAIRNFFYDQGWFKSNGFDVPVIVVGNLSVGGTGKTPMIEYLIRLLSEHYQVATLSRGYKRQTKGFILADATATAQTLGDEPFQIWQKFPDIQVAVDADRKNGIERLLSQNKKPQVILLDDAFQHRRVKAGFYILLTAYDDLFTDDVMLPTGNLRESKSGAIRANLIIVTKCPENLSEIARQEIKDKMRKYKKDTVSVFFTSIAYDDVVCSKGTKRKVAEIKTQPKLLVAGIAKPKPFFAYLQRSGDIALTYPDHHDFSAQDIDNIKKQAVNQPIVTTEKDYVRLKDALPTDALFYLPIKTSFVAQGNDFNQIILNYVGTSTTNR
ncbi:tetraacyldisaccharide 4'-kinase [Flavobacterium sp. CYK-4]|uniref:tetraacyldisaccharide 4'-kinase n=1 Tax=Flavobacterium lotistagni TaxID=2709660 RepID=UPI0014084F3F|nr:tetraacyldisaccharide 4'-kinase [Flavobacterium lotistagni]NHM06334.1 tetraacyldisaccharide 4'-kinase [Flavobacterium lotistagni]